jgi:toxin ParE1/3/4
MQHFKVRIRDSAYTDLQQAVDYYNVQQPGLGKRFFALFEHALEILKINPHFQLRFDTIRSLPLHSFPYSIYFDIEEENRIINIYAVVHQASGPDKITPRFKT